MTFIFLLIIIWIIFSMIKSSKSAKRIKKVESAEQNSNQEDGFQEIGKKEQKNETVNSESKQIEEQITADKEVIKAEEKAEKKNLEPPKEYKKVDYNNLYWLQKANESCCPKCGRRIRITNELFYPQKGDPLSIYECTNCDNFYVTYFCRYYVSKYDNISSIYLNDLFNPEKPDYDRLSDTERSKLQAEELKQRQIDKNIRLKREEYIREEKLRIQYQKEKEEKERLHQQEVEKEKKKYETLEKPREIYNTDIYEYLRNRGVRFLIHFTKISNLPSILKYGILSRKDLNNLKIEYEITDQVRMDDMIYGSCFSLSYPNYKYFYRIRQSSKSEFVILFINIEVIKTIPPDNIAFFPTNAANLQCKARFLQFTRLASAKDLFEPQNSFSRESQGIPSSYPTDPQAEVMIKGQVHPAYICGINIESSKSAGEIEKIIKEAKYKPRYKVNNEYYKPRIDYKKW